jgi:hypothetical protein
MEGDAVQTVNDVKATKQNWRRYEHLVEDTRGVLNMMQSWQICFAAHGLLF